jgi:hypothetical protein
MIRLSMSHRAWCSAIDVLSVSAAPAPSQLQIQNRTGFMDLLVHLGFQGSQERAARKMTRILQTKRSACKTVLCQFLKHASSYVTYVHWNMCLRWHWRRRRPIEG